MLYYAGSYPELYHFDANVKLELSWKHKCRLSTNNKPYAALFEKG